MTEKTENLIRQNLFSQGLKIQEALKAKSGFRWDSTSNDTAAWK
jgi:hypothetical protein